MRDSLMQDVERRAIDARVGLHRLCIEAGVSATIATRWMRRTHTPTLPTIGKLERKLAELENVA